MHPLMRRVLEQRQPAMAGQLFTLSYYEAITDLPSALTCIKEIFNSSTYVSSRGDQSVVEIAISLITGAIRETGGMETYCAELVDVLDSCLRHRMCVVGADGEKQVDSPHCRIASDLLSSLFLHYDKKSVMTLTLPVAMKALATDNQDLVNSVTSYISLAAIPNGKILSQYSIQILSQIINYGNCSLLRVLPQIYTENREPFHAHLPQLLNILALEQVDCSEKLSLLQLISMIASHKHEIILPYLDDLNQYLLSTSMCTAVLNIYMSLVSQGKAHRLAPYLGSLKAIAQRPAFGSNVATVSKIIGNIGRVSLPLATEAVSELIRSADAADEQLIPSILIEIEGIGEAFPHSVRPHVDTLRRILMRTSHKRVVERIISLATSPSPIMNDITLISIDNKMPEKNSSESLLSSSRMPPQQDSNANLGGPRLILSVCESSAADCSACELDRNTHSLAMQYQNRSSGSLSRHSRSRASVSQSFQGQRSASETVTMADSRDFSTNSMVGSSRAPPDYCNRAGAQSNKTQTLPATFAPTTQIQIGKDGRVRPIAGGRRPVQWPAGSYETTFPAHGGPVTTMKKMKPLNEEDDERWTNQPVDNNDVVQKFVDHRRNKIRKYVDDVTGGFSIPIQCTVEGSKASKHRMIVHFACQARGAHCVFNNDCLFAFKTKYPGLWLHLMFLQMQSTAINSSGDVVPQTSQAFLTLAYCWQCLPNTITRHKEFVTLVTSAFPNTKEREKLLTELEDASYFDCFQLDQSTNRWCCFSCAHPERVRLLVEDGKKLEGQLKEKRGRWRFLRRWHTKYFTLSNAALTSSTPQNESSALLPAIDLKNIRSVRSLSRGRRSRKSLRKAFEIFTSDNSSLILKATDEKKAEEWLHCLQIAVAHAKRETA